MNTEVLEMLDTLNGAKHDIENCLESLLKETARNGSDLQRSIELCGQLSEKAAQLTNFAESTGADVNLIEDAEALEDYFLNVEGRLMLFSETGK